MNRRSFVSVLAGLPFLSKPNLGYAKGSLSIADTLKRLNIEPSETTEEIEWQQRAAEARRNGLPVPLREYTIRDSARLLVTANIWMDKMTGLRKCGASKERLLGVTTGKTIWWFPLTLMKTDWPELRDVGIWFNALPGDLSTPEGSEKNL